MPLEVVKEDADKSESGAKVLREYEALSAAQAISATKDLNLVRDMDPEYASGLWDPETRAFIDALTLKSLFFSEDWVFINVDLIALKIASQWLRVMKAETKDGKVSEVPAEDHPFNKVIEAPNKFQDYFAFMYVAAVDTVLEGNAVIWSGATHDKMMLIPAESVGIDFAPDGSIVRYVSAELSTLDGQMQKVGAAHFPAEEIAHIRRPNPSSLLWGLSPFVPARKSILFNRYSSEYLNNFYLKGATPGLALEMSDAANEQVALRLLRSFEQAYTGRRNQRRTLVLPKGVTAKEVSHTVADQQLVDLVNMNRETILAILKVPPQEVGLSKAGSLGSEEYKTALKNFWASTLRPTQKLIAGALTKHFQPQLGEGFFLDFDNSDVEILQEDKEKKAGLAEKLLKTHTLNEVRADLYQLPPVPGGDVVMGQLTPGGISPFGLSVQNALAKAAEAAKQQQASAVVPETLSLPAAEESRDATQAAREAAADRALKSGDWIKRREAILKEAAESGEEEMVGVLLDLWGDMAAAVLKAVKKSMKKSHAPLIRWNVEPKTFKAEMVEWREKADVPSKTELRRRVRDAMGSFEERYIDETTAVLEAKVELGYDASLVVPFKMPAEDEVAALRDRGASGRLGMLEERSLFTFAKMNETTTEKVIGTVEAGVAKGQTVQEIAAAVAARFSDVESIKTRAMTIARTETLTAVSMGQAAAMKDLAETIPNLKKMWVNAGDARVRGNPGGLYPDSEADHWKLQGEVVDHDAKFSNGLLYPREAGGSANEVINCRCTWVVLPADEMEKFHGG